MYSFYLDFCFSPYISQSRRWYKLDRLLDVRSNFTSDMLREIHLYMEELLQEPTIEAYRDTDYLLVAKLTQEQRRLVLLLRAVMQVDDAMHWYEESASPDSTESVSLRQLREEYLSKIDTVLGSPDDGDWDIRDLVRRLRDFCQDLPEDSELVHRVLLRVAETGWLQMYDMSDSSDAADFAWIAGHTMAPPVFTEQLLEVFDRLPPTERVALEERLRIISTLHFHASEEGNVYLQELSVLLMDRMLDSVQEGDPTKSVGLEIAFTIVFESQGSIVGALESVIEQSRYAESYVEFVRSLQDGEFYHASLNFAEAVYRHLSRLATDEASVEEYFEHLQSTHPETKLTQEHKQLRQKVIRYEQQAVYDHAEGTILAAIPAGIDAVREAVQALEQGEISVPARRLVALLLRLLKDAHLHWFHELIQPLGGWLPDEYIDVMATSQLQNEPTLEAALWGIEQYGDVLSEPVEKVLMRVALKNPQRIQQWLQESPVMSRDHEKVAFIRQLIDQFVLNTAPSLSPKDINIMRMQLRGAAAPELETIALHPFNRRQRRLLLSDFPYSSDEGLTYQQARELLSPWRREHLPRVLLDTEVERDMPAIESFADLIPQCATKWETIQADSMLKLVRSNVRTMAELERMLPGSVQFLHDPRNGNISFFHRYGVPTLQRQYELMQSGQLEHVDNLAVFLVGQSDHNGAFDSYIGVLDTLRKQSDLQMPQRYQQVMPESVVFEASTWSDMLESVHSLYRSHRVRNIAAATISGHGTSNSVQLGDRLTVGDGTSEQKMYLNMSSLDNLFAIKKRLQYESSRSNFAVVKKSIPYLKSGKHVEGRQFFRMLQFLLDGDRTAFCVIACSGAKGQFNITAQLQSLLEGIAVGYEEDQGVQKMILVQDTISKRRQFVPLEAGAIKTVGE